MLILGLSKSVWVAVIRRPQTAWLKQQTVHTVLEAGKSKTEGLANWVSDEDRFLGSHFSQGLFYKVINTMHEGSTLMTSHLQNAHLLLPSSHWG